MTNRSEILSLRTILPVGLGVAIGLAIGAAALANVPVGAKSPAPAAQAISAHTPPAQDMAAQPLSAKPGISLARFRKDGERCVVAVVEGRSETKCAH